MSNRSVADGTGFRNNDNNNDNNGSESSEGVFGVEEIEYKEEE